MIVGLFSDLLPVGGVQAGGRQIAVVLAHYAREHHGDIHLLSLNDPAGEHKAWCGNRGVRFSGFGQSKSKFSFAAMKLTRKETRWIVAAHPHLAVPAAAMRVKARRARVMVFSHGIEVWKPIGTLRGRALRAANVVVAPSSDTARKLTEVQRVPRERIHILPWALDPWFVSSAYNAPLSKPPSVVAGKRYVLAVGRWSAAEKYKGFDTLIECLPQLIGAAPDVHLFCVGEGDDQARLERLGRERKVADRVHFISGLSREDLAKVYAHAQVFALPSKGEGFGVVFLEAMAAGRPVVGGNHGGIPDIIEDGVNGFLVEHGNVSQLTEKLKRLLASEGLREEMGQRGRDLVLRKYSFENFEAGLRRILGEADRVNQSS